MRARVCYVPTPMPTTEPLPFQVELSEADYFMLLRHAPSGSRVSARMIATVTYEREGQPGLRDLRCPRGRVFTVEKYRCPSCGKLADSAE